MMLIRFKHWDCELQRARYAENDRVALVLVDAGTGERIATATLNLGGEPLRDDEVIIKDYSENEGMVDALVAAKVIAPPHRTVQAGFCQGQVCSLVISPSD